jgi:hypothetical protein
MNPIHEVSAEVLARNVERADLAAEGVAAFRAVCVGDMDETALYDLVADMGHLCDKLTAEQPEFNLTFEDMVERARVHYEGERDGDGFA